MKYRWLIFLVLILTLGCDRDSDNTIGSDINYSDDYYWASKPISPEMKIDVFYVYPTLFGGVDEKNMDITDSNMRDLVQYVIPKQAGIFYDQCNIYVPYYRQMSLDGLSMSEDDRNKYFVTGLADIEDAFEYYLNHLNNDRPFFLAGHSQGSEILIELLKNRFQDKELMSKLVAAYVIGYSVTEDDINEHSWLKISQSDDDIGVIVTYNTQSESATDSPVLLIGAKCTNPLTWTTTTQYAPKELNKGAVFFNKYGEVDSTVNHFTDARIEQNGALIAETPDVNTYSTSNFPEGVYHVYDYSFFYNNLKENVGIRKAKYLSIN